MVVLCNIANITTVSSVRSATRVTTQWLKQPICFCSVVRKSEKSLDMGELTFHAEKTACCGLQQETKVDV